MPGSYDPADSGLAKYFLAMLDDADRNNQYSRAIKACIDEFKANNKGKAPTVLDIGVGTGMLSGLCLLHGAKHVTGVDVNSTMVQLAKTSLEQVQQKLYPDAARKSYTVKLVKKGASQLGNAKYDMFVSEILGTLTTSESMFKYITIYAPHLNTFDNGQVYCVPRSTTQYFSIRAFERSDLGGSLCAALDGAMSSVEAARKLVPTNEGGIGLHLQLYKSKLCGEMYKIHTEKYERLDDNGKFEVISGSPATLATIPQKELDIEIFEQCKKV